MDILKLKIAPKRAHICFSTPAGPICLVLLEMGDLVGWSIGNGELVWHSGVQEAPDKNGG